MADEEKASTNKADDITMWNPENISEFPNKNQPTVFTNRYQFIMGPETTRLVFGQSLVGEPDASWFHAVTMPTWVAVDMAKSILSIHHYNESQGRKDGDKT